MFRFAKRTDWQFGSNPLINRLEGLRKDKAEILDLTESNPTKCGIDYPKEKILRALSKRKNLEYAPSPRGSEEARKAVQEYYRQRGFEVPLERIFLTSSTSEGYSFLFKLLVDNGGSVLFPEPSYPLFDCLVDLHDIKMEYFKLHYEGQWKINEQELQRKIHQDTGALVLVNPNNPTGSYIKADELKVINQLCAKRDLAIISDEVFWDYVLDASTSRVSLVDNKDVLSFTLGGISKSLALPQMKLSWIVINGPDELVDAAIARLEIISDTYLSVSTPIQNSLSEWFVLLGDIQGQVKARLEENLFYLRSCVNNSKLCELYHVEGGWYAVLKMNLPIDEEEWMMRLLEHHQVFIHPGYFFSFEGNDSHAVLSLLTPPDVFKEGLGRLLETLAKSS